MYAISKNTTESAPALQDLLGSKNYPAIIQASALEQYTQFYNPTIIELVKNYLQSTDPNLRLNALHAAANLPENVLLPLIVPLLDDPVISVRTEAMNTIAPLYLQLDENKKQRFDAVMNEYLAIQRNLGDRPESYLNSGIALAATGRTNEAEQTYLLGLKRFPKFIAYYGNLADLYRAEKNEPLSKQYLDRGLSLQPTNSELHYAIALWHIRNQDRNAGLNELKKASELDPGNASFTYGYALALHSTHDVQKAISTLENFIAKHGNDPLIISGLISICADAKQMDKVNSYTKLRKDVFGY